MESIHDKEKSPVLSEVIPTVASDDYALETVDERKLLRKIDWHVVPWLALLYLLNFLDRGNIGNARVRALSSINYL